MYELENKWSSKESREFLKKTRNQARARAVGLDINATRTLIREVIEEATPDLRRLFKVDLPAKINEAIRELKAQKSRGFNRFDQYNIDTAKMEQSCKGGSQYIYDSSHKLRKICRFDKGNALDDFCAGR